jgi:hypothetical protein
MFTFMNYLVFHWQLELDALYMHPLEISDWLAVTFVLTGPDNLEYDLLEYRLGELGLNESFAENIKWLPFLQFPLSRTSYNSCSYLVTASSSFVASLSTSKPDLVSRTT